MRDLIKTELLPPLIFGALVLLVVLTAVLGRPKRLPVGVEFPAPFGARLICWAQLVLWTLLILAPIELGWYWLAAVLALGPIYTLYRWPETISITEWEIRQSAWCHADVSIPWTEIETIELSAFGDSLVVRSRDGRKIRVSSLQVGAPTLVSEIEHWSGHVCPAFNAHA